MPLSQVLLESGCSMSSSSEKDIVREMKDFALGMTVIFLVALSHGSGNHVLCLQWRLEGGGEIRSGDMWPSRGEC